MLTSSITYSSFQEILHILNKAKWNYTDTKQPITHAAHGASNNHPLGKARIHYFWEPPILKRISPPKLKKTRDISFNAQLVSDRELQQKKTPRFEVRSHLVVRLKNHINRKDSNNKMTWMQTVPKFWSQWWGRWRFTGHPQEGLARPFQPLPGVRKAKREAWEESIWKKHKWALIPIFQHFHNQYLKLT